uniref:Putative secreted protein n=1 Tax=Ixodes ricinus TaxID=34613 RepID=A0A6B0UW42_IXORI
MRSRHQRAPAVTLASVFLESSRADVGVQDDAAELADALRVGDEGHLSVLGRVPVPASVGFPPPATDDTTLARRVDFFDREADASDKVVKFSTLCQFDDGDVVYVVPPLVPGVDHTHAHWPVKPFPEAVSPQFHVQLFLVFATMSCG